MAKIKSDSEQEVARFIKILIGVVVIVCGLYLFTNNFVTKDSDSKYNSTEGTIDETKIIVGSILNRPQEEYYVFAYKSKDNTSSIYGTYFSKYKNKDDALSIYMVDLDNALNEKYYDEVSKTDVSNIKDIKLSNPTLLKVKSNKIVKSYTSSEEIKKELGL